MADTPIQCFTEHTNISVRCGTCGEENEYNDGVVVFPDKEAATKFVREAGWLVDGDVAECVDCRARRLCREEGHVWDEWRDCACDGRIAEHTVQMDLRRCERCWEGAYRPANEGGGQDG